jgi:hypothetical protein
MFIPDYAYIRIMKVLLQRGRLRWKRSNTYIYDSWNNNSNNNSSSNNNNNNNNNNSVIICAADQLEELLQEYESQPAAQYFHTVSSSDLSTTTKSSTMTANATTITPPSIEMYNLVLEAYAICATPRGDRQYAQRAQSLLQRMEQEQQAMMSFNHSRTTNSTDHHHNSITTNPNQYLLPVESYLHVLHA